MHTRNYILVTGLYVGCGLLLGDQTFGSDQNGQPDIHDASAAVAFVAKSAGIPVPAGYNEIPAVPAVPAPKAVLNQLEIPSDKPALISLAEFICHQKLSDTSGADFLVYFGLGLGHPLRWRTAGHGTWALGIPGEYCSDDGKFLEKTPAVLIMVHGINFEAGKREANFYLATLGGTIIKAVHNDPKTPRGLANTNNPKIVSDFELTKNTWLAITHAEY